MIKRLPPRLLSFLLIAFFASSSLIAQQEIIHCWNFNTPTGITGNQFPSPVNEVNRIIGNGTITHNFAPSTTQAFAGSAQNSCGTSAGSAFVVRGGASLINNGKHIDFNFSTKGFENLELSFWSRRSGSGFTINQIQYSTDGTNFTDFPSGSYFPSSATTGSVLTFSVPSFIEDLNDKENLIIRILFSGASDPAGNNYIDNLKLEGIPINTTDDDSVVVTPENQVLEKTIVAAEATAPAQAESIFSFNIQDLGTSDGLPTNVTRMRFLEGLNNTVNWSTAINALILKDGNGDEVEGNFSIFGSEIIFEPNSPVSIADGTSENFTIEAVLNQTGIIDGTVIQLSISEVDSEFEADNLGSRFTNFFPAEVLGNPITIDVVATELSFLQEPSNVRRLATMQPPVEVEFIDVNGNRDLDATSTVEIESTGTLVDSPVSVDAVEGLAIFSNLVHSVSGIDLELTASTLDPFTVTSGFFDVIDNDEDSEVVAPQVQIANSTIIAANSTATPTPVFNFDISDLGSGDELPTEVNQMRFVAGPNNTTDWSSNFSSITILDESGTPIDGDFTSSEDEIIFIPNSPVSVADGTSGSFSIEVILNPTGIVDQSVIQFQVEGENSGFGAEPTGSAFNSVFIGGAVSGNNITIDVIASEIAFVQQPTDVEVNAFISPAVQVGYVDENGNIDTSITTDISLVSSDLNLVDPLNPVPAVNGVTTFPNIGYTAEATGVILTAETNEPTINPSTLDSNPFDVGTPVIAIQDFDGTTPEWNYTTSPSTFDNGWETSYFGVINSADASPLASGSFVENIFGVNNLNVTGSLNFVTVNVSGYTNVNLSFDWEAIGNASSTESITYEVFVDGIGQGVVNLYNGDATILSGSGTVSETIPPGTQEVSLVVTVQDNAADSYIGLDNFALTGDSNARDTDIIAPIDGQIPAGTLIADINDNLANAAEVFSFEVVDSGNFDNLPTNITRLRFVPGALNTANWEDVIQGISISDGTTTLDQGNQTLTITPTEILLDIDADPDTMFSVDDASSKTYTISIFLNESGITDQQVIQLAIAEGNENQLASSDGSLFSNAIAAFEGNEFLIDVVGNGLEFTVQPITTLINVNMTPSVRVANTDANGNIDLDNVGQVVSITSTGTLTTTPISNTFGANGTANFNTIRHTQPGFDLTLEATSGSIPSVISDEFDILQKQTLLISEVVAPSDDTNGRYVELFNMDVEQVDLGDQTYILRNPTGTGTSVQLTGIIPPKSYYVISFVDAPTFNAIYGRDPDFVAPSDVASTGQDVYFLSFDEAEPRATLDSYGIVSETGTTPTDWEFTEARAYRNIPTVRVSNSIYDETEWTLEGSSTTDATIGIGDNDFIYTNDVDEWGLTGIGASPEDSVGLNPARSIFIEEGTVTLTLENTISDVIVRNGATLIIEDAITLNGDFANFGKVTFRSTETKTAVLGPFNGLNRRLVGANYEIERYVPQSNRAYRYLSSPVTTTSSPKPSINANWQEGQNNTQTGDANNSNTLDGFGTHITGSTTGANGFDATLTGNPNMFQWNGPTQQWNHIANTNSTTFKAGDAYALLIRGSRASTLNSNTATGPATTLRTTGRLVVGSRGVSNTSNTVGGFTLVGNPYQAKIDMKALLSSNNFSGVNANFAYIYDPTIGTVGGYATLDFTEDSTTPSTSGANQFLEPNQAFFVEATSASPAYVIPESFKTTATTNNTTFSLPEELTNLSISLKTNQDVPKTIDAVRVKFRPGGNNAKDTLDAPKLWNYEEWFAINRDPEYLSIETRAMPTVQDSVPIYFGNSKLNAYRLEIYPENFAGIKAYLYDNYLETSVELTSNSTTSYSFQLDNAIPASKATDRFVIKFDEVTLSNDEFNLGSDIAVYPNPVRGERFSISHNQAFSGKSVDLKIFDLQGRLVIQQNIANAPTVEVNVGANLSAGVYILKLADDHRSQSIKLIVE